MELKSYQKQVIEDLKTYFSYLQISKTPDKAFNEYWENKAGQYNSLTGEGMRPYRDNINTGVHLSIKVPTAGGKTFIACNALKTIFDAMPEHKTKAVIWLVPWSNLLDQTVKNLSNTEHPYCQKLNSLFNNRVRIYEKKDLLQGASFNPSAVREQLSIMVMNFASIRAKNKDDRKIFEQNGALAMFGQPNSNNSHLLEGTDETALINVIRNLNPVLIVDESHNAESPLSIDMLQNLNPSFILDLTATPKENANIVSFVSAVELKKEHMVKLPVIVYNHHSIEGVVESALHLREKLEIEAKEIEAKGGRNIRPMVLFQAQSKGKEESTTFEKLKAQLMSLGIPSEEIKIKTANIDELKGIDLMDKDCPVRFVITINALKEGWDCPFAYILASLADRSSEVDVTQILGRVLRQPYVMKHGSRMLNLSYVITASAKFHDTIQSIIKGLQESGFSEKDYREKDAMPDLIKEEEKQSMLDDFLFSENKQDAKKPVGVIDTNKIAFSPNASKQTSISSVAEIEQMAIQQSEELEKQIETQPAGPSPIQILSEMGIKTKHYPMRDNVSEIAKEITLPKFVITLPNLQTFDLQQGDTVLLDRTNLLKGFELAKKDIDIPFDSVTSELYKIDTEETLKGDYKVSSVKIEKQLREPFNEYILAKPKEGQIKDISNYVAKQIGSMPPMFEPDIRKYVNRILEEMDLEQLRDFLQHKLTYTDLIKQKINKLADQHAERNFNDWQIIRKIKTQSHWKFDEAIITSKTADDIGNSLYVKEGEMNGLEQQFIMDISGYSNIAFWHRNLGRGKGFSLNGFKSDHYPDFIIVTKSNKVILVETKGSDRDNSDSEAKVRLGEAWSKLSGSDKYHYMMVFEKNAIPGAYAVDKAKELIRQM